MGFPGFPGTQAEASINHVDPYNERSAELMDVLAMLYFVIEHFRGDETFGEELSAHQAFSTLQFAC